VKFHVGCGTVYLDGWMNVDLPGPHTYLARERPDLVDRWITTDDRYYARHEDKTVDSLRQGPLEQEFVCDEFGSFISLPYADAGLALKIDEVLARHSFEHLSIREARFGLWKISRQLMPDGILRLDVPDHEQTLKLLMETKDPFYIRHLLGPRRNDYGFHMMSFTPDRLRKLVEEYGFEFIEEEPNIHIYPAFCLRFRRKH
jgi:predicted SAM-dependent methyltransferase